MKKKYPPTRPGLVYVGFVNGRPHVQDNAGVRAIAAYTSKSSARRAYDDVRMARLIFDTDWAVSADEAVRVALKDAHARDRAERPTMDDVLAYCLKLGIESYLAGQPEDEDDVTVRS